MIFITLFVFVDFLPALFLELYYCNMVEWFWWDLSLIFDDQLVSFSALILLVWSSGL